MLRAFNELKHSANAQSTRKVNPRQFDLLALRPWSSALIPSRENQPARQARISSPKSLQWAHLQRNVIKIFRFYFAHEDLMIATRKTEKNPPNESIRENVKLWDLRDRIQWMMMFIHILDE